MNLKLLCLHKDNSLCSLIYTTDALPICHPVTGTGEVNVKAGGSGIANILQSLLGSQTSEGED